MLKFWGKNNLKAAANNVGDPERLDSLLVVEMMKKFPISTRVRCYSKVHGEDLYFDSIIIAYGLNNTLVYSQKDIDYRPAGADYIFNLSTGDGEVSVRDIYNMYFIMPDHQDLDSGMDYVSRAALDRDERYTRGNRYKLVSESLSRNQSQIEVEVRRRMRLDEGCYKGHDVVVMRIAADSLNIVDQRKRFRLTTHIPMMLHFVDDDRPIDCVLIDASEQYFRIEIGDHPILSLPSMLNKDVIMDITLEEPLSIYLLKGRLLRQDPDSVLIELRGIMKDKDDDRFRSLDTLDAINIQSTLMQHPKSS